MSEEVVTYLVIKKVDVRVSPVNVPCYLILHLVVGEVLVPHAVRLGAKGVVVHLARRERSLTVPGGSPVRVRCVRLCGNFGRIYHKLLAELRVLPASLALRLAPRFRVLGQVSEKYLPSPSPE